MNTEFDINQAAAAFVEAKVDSFLDLGANIFNQTATRVRLKLTRTYRAYLGQVLGKYSRAKSFLLRTEPVHLYQFYVPLAIGCGKTFVAQPGIGDINRLSPFSILMGSAGSGKSIFMRHLLLNCVLTNFKVPIFIELRQLSQTDVDLLTLLNQTLEQNKLRLGGEYVERALEAGHFALFLDGFDELAQAKRQSVTEQIQSLARRFDKNLIVVSSRPDNELEGWPEFSLVQLQPLTLDLACDLVDKIPYDDELKIKFLSELREELFEKHRSFLSNPLLLSIMLLTYGQSGHIPNKMNVFYGQAYEALFERHDALKSGYQRQRRTALDIQDYGRIFAAFCLQTYDQRRFEFSYSDALAVVERAKQIVAIDCNGDHYLKDALQAVCLLVEDGLMIVFSHRSFQEYFAARFIAEARPAVQKRLVERYAPGVRIDAVMRLLHEMRPEMVEQTYILPSLTRLYEDLGVGTDETIGLDIYLRFIKRCWQSFLVDGESIVATHGEGVGWIDPLYFGLRECGHLVGWSWGRWTREGPAHLLKRYGGGKPNVEIQTAGLTLQNDFVADLAEKGSLFSIATLRAGLRLRAALADKLKSLDASLDEILNAADGQTERN